ncbi:MAG TPA: T9SS type A sorting domain-containing protein [Cyclobacteriaceae bacterium]|nr:T9SS type A sorting domain-containing protein [Cyclobacteriaceae bacterium]
MKLLTSAVLLLVAFVTCEAQRIVRVAGGEINGKPALESDVMPYRLAVGADGTIYFMDQSAWTIRKIDPVTGLVSRFAGNSNFGVPATGTPALESPMMSLDCMELGPDGLVYLAGAGSVIRVDANGKIERVAGNVQCCSSTESGDGGPALSAKLQTITDIVFDSHGNLFIAGGNMGKIRKVDAVTKIITTYAGTGTTTSSGDNGPAIDAGMYPLHLAIDDDDNLYVSDIASNAIRKIDPATGIITRFAGDGTNGFSGDGGQALNAKFKDSPRYMAIKGDEMFISDYGNFRIRKVIISTGIITTIAGNGTLGDSGDNGPALDAQLETVQDLNFDKNGDLIFYCSGRMRKISGTTISTAAGIGYAPPDGTLALESILHENMCILVMPNGDIVYADATGNRIRKIDHTTSIISTIAGSGVYGFSGDNGPATSAKLYSPHALLLDGDGNIIFTDRWNNRVRKINMTTGIITTIAGNGGTNNNGDGGLATSAQLNDVLGLDLDNNGDVIFTSGHKIRKIDHVTGIITTIAGNGGQGSAGDGGPAIDAQLLSPYAIKTTSDGSIYIADYSIQTIRKIDGDGIITNFAGKGQGVVKYAGSSGGGVFFSQPFALTLAPNGDLYVGSYGQVTRIDMTSKEMYTVSGSGSPQGSTGDGGAAIDARLAYPFGITFNAAGDLLISDGGRSVIRKVVARVAQTITFNTLENHSLNETSFDITNAMAYSSSGLTITFESSDPSIASVSGNTITLHKAGSVNITAKQATGNVDYLPATPVTRTLVIDKKTQTITFGPLSEKVSGATAFKVEATASSGLTISYESSNTSVATISGDMVTIVGAGTTSIIARQSGNEAFEAAPAVEQFLSVIAPGVSAQTITFEPLSSKTFGDSSFDLTATASSGLPVEFTSSNQNVATISGTKVTIVGGGQTTIAARQPGSSTYAAASPVEQTLTVAKASQVITFPAISAHVVGDKNFQLTATASSSLTVEYSTTSTNVTIIGGEVKINSAGKVIVKASQPGDSRYNAAASVDQSFCVNPSKPVITVSNATLTSDQSIGNQWYLNGTAITGATSKSYTVIESGSYTVKATAGECSSQFSQPVEMVVTGVNEAVNTEAQVYPTLVKDDLYVKVGGDVTLHVTDLQGRIILTKAASAGTHTIDVRNYPSGMYILRINVKSFKFLKLD